MPNFLPTGESGPGRRGAGEGHATALGHRHVDRIDQGRDKARPAPHGAFMRIFAAMIGVLLLGLSGQACAETMRFAITRNGDQIGTHSIEINRAGPEISVNIATDLVVKVLFVTAYRFQHMASERWVNGRHVALDSTTDNNGTRHQVSIVMKTSGLEMAADGKASRVDRNIMPASLWNPELMRRTAMLDAQDGDILPLSVVDQGMDELTIEARTVKAHHYTIKSRFSQDVWYDEQQRLVQAKLIGRDGSVILYKPI
jgi:hypothetical protein